MILPLQRMNYANAIQRSDLTYTQVHRRDVDSFYHLSGCSLAGKACNGTACFIARHLNPSRWAEAAKQTPRVYCLGRCFAAPAIAIGSARPHVEVRSREAVVLRHMVKGVSRTLASYIAQGGYRSLEKGLELSPGEIVFQMELSELRGRGGAGFPTGRKWRSVFEAAASRQQKNGSSAYVIANADEGDSGAYIDHFIIEDDPFALLEGMTIAAKAVGASRGWIYLRAEHPQGEAVLRDAIAEARHAGFLGERVLGHDFSFDIDVAVGRGSYVCGEETALIRSIEGRRPEPQARPPMPSVRGLFGKPTLVNNVETIANVPWIVERGAETYRALGFSNSRGTKAVSLNSLFNRPGLYEIEFGVSVRQIVEELGGGLRTGRLKGVIIGGPLAGIIPPHLLDTPFGFEELHAIGASVGHGGVVAFDEHTSIAALMHHVFSFGAYESCGKCTPCRLGSPRIEHIFADIVRDGAANYWDEKECERIISALKLTSLCGMGTGLAEFAESALRHYGKELELCFR